MKIITVAGARPQFMKATVVSHVLRNRYQEILGYTGQHYDCNMSEQFFEENENPEKEIYRLGTAFFLQ